jgi:hypothetical protein
LELGKSKEIDFVNNIYFWQVLGSVTDGTKETPGFARRNVTVVESLLACLTPDRACVVNSIANRPFAFCFSKV